MIGFGGAVTWYSDRITSSSKKDEITDLIFMDLIMPGMDGVQLLEEVRRLYPNVIRVILSGHSDQNRIMSSIRPAHQFLAKPIDQAALISILGRALALHNVLTDPALARLLSQVEALPALPDVYTQLLKEIKAHAVSGEDI